MTDKPGDKALQEFLSEAQEIVESFNRALLKLDEDRAASRFDPEVLNDAFRAVHSLKGVSGLFGVNRITQLAHQPGVAARRAAPEQGGAVAGRARRALPRRRGVPSPGAGGSTGDGRGRRRGGRGGHDRGQRPDVADGAHRAPQHPPRAGALGLALGRVRPRLEPALGAHRVRGAPPAREHPHGPRALPGARLVRPAHHRQGARGAEGAPSSPWARCSPTCLRPSRRRPTRSISTSCSAPPSTAPVSSRRWPGCRCCCTTCRGAPGRWLRALLPRASTPARSHRPTAGPPWARRSAARRRAPSPSMRRPRAPAAPAWPTTSTSGRSRCAPPRRRCASTSASSTTCSTSSASCRWCAPECRPS